MEMSTETNAGTGDGIRNGVGTNNVNDLTNKELQEKKNEKKVLNKNNINKNDININKNNINKNDINKNNSRNNSEIDKIKEKEKWKKIGKENRSILTMNHILEKHEWKENIQNEKKNLIKKKLIYKNKNKDKDIIEKQKNIFEMRTLIIPKQRKSAVIKNWIELIRPIVTHLKLEIRMHNEKIEVRTCTLTEDKRNLQKCSDYLKAFLLGFTMEDAQALLRIEDLYIESFQIQDVKNLKGDHLSRCIGRICGSNGSTKYAIENATKTRIVVAEDKIHILGSFDNIKMARYSICNLILGCTQGKIFNKLNILSRRLKENF